FQRPVPAPSLLGNSRRQVPLVAEHIFDAAHTIAERLIARLADRYGAGFERAAVGGVGVRPVQIEARRHRLVRTVRFAHLDHRIADAHARVMDHALGRCVLLHIGPIERALHERDDRFGPPREQIDDEPPPGPVVRSVSSAPKVALTNSMSAGASATTTYGVTVRNPSRMNVGAVRPALCCASSAAIRRCISSTDRSSLRSVMSHPYPNGSATCPTRSP